MSGARYGTLDAWRGLACLGVIVFHSTVYIADGPFASRVQSEGGGVAEWACVVCSRLWIGVPLFFVISGYCIAAAAVNGVERGRGIGTFLVRRFRRIYPPLWIYLIFSTTALMLLPEALLPGPAGGFEQPIPRPQSLAWWHWLGQFTLTEEWRGNVVGPPKHYFAGQLWTLCYEEQFYLAMAACAAVARRWLFAAVAAISTVVALILIDVVRPGFPINGFFFDGLWLAFAAGVIVYLPLPSGHSDFEIRNRRLADHVRRLGRALGARLPRISARDPVKFAGRGLRRTAVGVDLPFRPRHRRRRYPRPAALVRGALLQPLFGPRADIPHRGLVLLQCRRDIGRRDDANHGPNVHGVVRGGGVGLPPVRRTAFSKWVSCPDDTILKL